MTSAAASETFLIYQAVDKFRRGVMGYSTTPFTLPVDSDEMWNAFVRGYVQHVNQAIHRGMDSRWTPMCLEYKCR